MAPRAHHGTSTEQGRCKVCEDARTSFPAWPSDVIPVSLTLTLAHFVPVLLFGGRDPSSIVLKSMNHRGTIQIRNKSKIQMAQNTVHGQSFDWIFVSAVSQVTQQADSIRGVSFVNCRCYPSYVSAADWLANNAVGPELTTST